MATNTNEMPVIPTPAISLTRLLQLASPALPVGAYSYSQGLEAAIEARTVTDAVTARAWIEDVLELAIAGLDAPVFLRLAAAWEAGDEASARRWNDVLLASRESAEFRAETVQMGYSLARLLTELGEKHPFDDWNEVSYTAAYAWWAVRSRIERRAALTAYLWSWAENQVICAVKTVPLGQSAGQRLLFALGPVVAGHAARAETLGDDALGNLAPGLALLSAQHETQYSRLFRS
jgi:urease accessory protein